MTMYETVTEEKFSSKCEPEMAKAVIKANAKAVVSLLVPIGFAMLLPGGLLGITAIAIGTQTVAVWNILMVGVVWLTSSLLTEKILRTYVSEIKK